MSKISGSGGGGTSLPATDATEIVKGSADATKKVRIEADGLTTGTTRVWTAPDANTNIPVAAHTITFAGLTAARTVTLPDANFTAGAGDFVGPASATDNAIVRFDSTTGKLGQNSTAKIDDDGQLNMPGVLGTRTYFGTDTDTGWGWRADNTLSAYAGASEQVRISNAGLETFSDIRHNLQNGASNYESYMHEQITLSLAGTTTVSSANLAPANARIKAIMYRVTTTITGTTDYSIKVTGGTNFVALGTATAAQTGLTATSTGTLVPANYADQFNTSATTITITTTGTPLTGVIRVIVFFEQYVVPSA